MTEQTKISGEKHLQRLKAIEVMSQEVKKYISKSVRDALNIINYM